MAKDSSASTHQQTPHTNSTTHENRTTRTATIIDALKRRAQAVLNDESLDAQSRMIIRHGLETNDPWLAELLRHAEPTDDRAGTLDFSETTTATDDLSRAKLEALAEMICAGGDESAAALLVLMGKFQNAGDPRVLAHTVKHFAFTRCGELNVNGMVDAQIEIVESELFAGNTRLA